jgi:hypothetical protein
MSKARIFKSGNSQAVRLPEQFRFHVDGVERYPYIIPGALLTMEVDLAELIGLLPPRTWLVLYATDRIPQSCSRLRLLRDDLSFYVLTGGLRSWWDANFEMDSVDQYAGGLRTRGWPTSAPALATSGQNQSSFGRSSSHGKLEMLCVRP